MAFDEIALSFNNILITDNVLPANAQIAASKTGLVSSLAHTKVLEDEVWKTVYSAVKKDDSSLLFLFWKPIPKDYVTKVLKEQKTLYLLGSIINGNLFDLETQEKIFNKNKKSQYFLESILNSDIPFDSKFLLEAFHSTDSVEAKAKFLCKTDEALFTDEEAFLLASDISLNVKDKIFFWSVMFSKRPSFLKYFESKTHIDSDFIIAAFSSRFANDLDLSKGLTLISGRGESKYNNFLRSALGNVFLDPVKLLDSVKVFFKENPEHKPSDAKGLFEAITENRIQENVFIKENQPLNHASVSLLLEQYHERRYDLPWFVKTFDLTPFKSFFTKYVNDTIISEDKTLKTYVFETFGEFKHPLARPLDKIQDLEINPSDDPMRVVLMSNKEQVGVCVTNSLQDASVEVWENFFSLSESFAGTIKELVETAKTL